jgi:hypothetical protein
MPLSLNIPCGLCSGGGGGTQASASIPISGGTRGEGPPPVSTADDDIVRRRAAFEMECEAKKLEIVVLDSHTRGVTGCSKRAVYVKDCSKGPCDWLPKPQTADAR